MKHYQKDLCNDASLSEKDVFLNDNGKSAVMMMR